MTANGLIQIVLYLGALALFVKPMGIYMASVYQGELNIFVRLLGPAERFIYRICGVRQDEEMSWQTYSVSVLLFSFTGMVVLYILQRMQGLLPLNPQGFPSISPGPSFNTAVSFTTNTNWQGYSGETTMSYLTQMMGLGVQNFLSAAAGMAVLVALIRGFARHTAKTIGNFWVDITRTILYILLPLSTIFAVLLVSQGVIQSFSAYHTVPLVQAIGYTRPVLDSHGNRLRDSAGKEMLETVTVKDQILPSGPAASQVAIKQLGTNGGGFFNTNSSHPYENPTPFSNFLELLAILLIPAALCYTFGKMVGDMRQSRALLTTMIIIFTPLLMLCYYSEMQGNPFFKEMGIDQTASVNQAGGNMEGKEARFGIANSALWATATTAASNGSVNSMHDSFTPLGGLAPMLLIQLGEIVFGGVGSGLYGMIIFAIVAVFIAGLMVGRTPESLGKKIEAFEMKMASLVILIPAAFVLLGTAAGVVANAGVSGIANPGPHGLSEILYAFSSTANNNGSAFAGLSANTPFYNILLGIVMLFGRFWVMIPVLAIAGSLAAKKQVPAGPGTLPTHTTLFILFLAGVIMFVGALTFFPALALGPVVEHLIAGK